MSGFRDSPAEFFVRFTMPCIETVITGHLEVLFRYMLDKQRDEVHYGKGFFNVGIVFVLIVVKGHIFTIIGINAGGCNNRTSEITADVFYHGVSVTEIGLGIDIEPVFVFFVNGSFYFFERSSDAFIKFIKKSSLESLTEIRVVKVFNDSPEAVIGEAAFGKKTMDMRIPFEGPAEGVEDTDKTGDKISGFVQFMEHSENDTANSLKKAVKQGTVIEKERA